MFLGDVKGYLFDKSDKAIPTEPTESAKAETAETVNFGELLNSAVEIGTITKDVMVEETMGCAAWSFAAFLAGLDHATSVEEPIKAKTKDQAVADPVAVEGLSLLAEQILVVVALRFENLRHAMIGFHPIMHAVPHDIGIEVITVTHGQEDPERFLRCRGNQRLMKVPGTTRCFRVKWPLLVHKST